MIEETLAGMCETADELKEKFFGVVTGTVISALDPMMLGRVQVQLPFIDDVDLSPWARIATPMAGPGHGMYFIPNLGDEVLVAFEHGNRDVPYVIGSLWSAMAPTPLPPPLPPPLPQNRLISTLAGNQIEFTELPPSITIKTPTGQTIVMSALDGVKITTGLDEIHMTSAGVTISSPVITLDGKISIDLKAPKINVTSTAITTVNGGGACEIKAGVVKIN